MRKVILGAAITLDGCIARPDGSVDYLHMTKDGAADMARFFASMDTIIYRPQDPGRGRSP